MGIKYTAQNYADFQTVAANAPFRIGSVYYASTSGGFFAIALAADFSSWLYVSQSTVPPSFATDYPNAIQLTIAPVAGSNFDIF